MRVRFSVDGTDVFVSVFRSHVEPRIASVFGRFEHLHDIYLSAVKYVSDKAMLISRKTYAFIDAESIGGITGTLCDDLCPQIVRIVARTASGIICHFLIHSFFERKKAGLPILRKVRLSEIMNFCTNANSVPLDSIYRTNTILCRSYKRSRKVCAKSVNGS